MITTTVVIDLKQLIKCITERKLPDDMKILSGVKLPDELNP